MRLFVSSPSDVAPERARVEVVAARLNGEYEAVNRKRVQRLMRLIGLVAVDGRNLMLDWLTCRNEILEAVERRAAGEWQLAGFGFPWRAGRAENCADDRSGDQFPPTARPSMEAARLEERVAGAISRSQTSNWPVGAAQENQRSR